MLATAYLKLGLILRAVAVVVYLLYYIVREIYIAYRYRFVPFCYLYNSYLANRRDYGLYSRILYRLRRRILRNILEIGLYYLS